MLLAKAFVNDFHVVAKSWRRRSYQLKIEVSCTRGGRSESSFVLGNSTCACRLFIEPLLDELRYDGASAESLIILEYLSWKIMRSRVIASVGDNLVQGRTMKHLAIYGLACCTRTRGAAHISPNLAGLYQQNVGSVRRWFV